MTDVASDSCMYMLHLCFCVHQQTRNTLQVLKSFIDVLLIVSSRDI